MYVLYEHHMDESGNIFATDMLMTSVFPGTNGINFKNNNEVGVFLFVKNNAFKATHISKYSYDDNTKVWSFLGNAGRVVYDKLKDSPFILLKLLKFEPVEDLIAQAASHRIQRPVHGVKYNPQDFFYAQAQAVSTVLTREQIASNLAKLLLVSDDELLRSKRDEIKRVYRQRALALHPDRTGNGEAMSELNSWWQQYQQYLSA